MFERQDSNNPESILVDNRDLVELFPGSSIFGIKNASRLENLNDQNDQLKESILSTVPRFIIKVSNSYY